MNICLMRFGAVVESEGGTEKVLCNRANEFTNRGHNITIICCEKKQGKPFFELSDKVNLVNLNDTGKEIKGCVWLRVKRELLKAVGKLDRTEKDKIFIESRYDNDYIKNRFNKIISDIKPDIIIAYDYLSVLFLKHIMKNSLSTIAMIHNDVDTYFNNNASKLQLNAYNMVDCIQILNKHKVELVKEYCCNAQVVYIPNAVPQIKNVRNSNNEKIITVGSLTKSIKRPDIILKAFNTIKNTFPNWTVEIVGGTHDLKQEEYKAELEKYIKNNNLDDMVFLSGRTLNITEKLLSAEIFAFPSKSEAFGLALAEAMSSGLPAIGYKSCPSVNELIIDGYNGFLCDDGIDAFAEKMKILMQNKELRKQMGQNAKESIKQFEPEKIWNQWEDLMKKVIKIKKY